MAQSIIIKLFPLLWNHGDIKHPVYIWKLYNLIKIRTLQEIDLYLYRHKNLIFKFRTIQEKF